MAKINIALKVLQAERDVLKDMLNRQQESLPAQERLVALTKQDIVHLKLDLEEVERAMELLTTGEKSGKTKKAKNA